MLASPVPIAYPQQGWEDISTAFSSLKGVLQFNTSHIVTYFVNRSVSDGLPASDFKSVNNSAEYLFRCGHVQAILVCSNEKYLFIKAKCLPEMRKDRVYLLNMAIIRPGCDIVSAECGCPAGKGPQGSCKHVGALSYALSDICRIQVLPQYQTCTDQLQQWNQPHGRHINPIPVDQLGSRRRELLPPRKRATGSMTIFDPRPLPLRAADPVALERFRCDLLTLQQPCAFLSVIIPSVKKIEHDHCYFSHKDLEKLDIAAQAPSSPFSLPMHVSESNTVTKEDVLDSLFVNEEERTILGKKTRSQSDSADWHEARRLRITGSKCGCVDAKEKDRSFVTLLHIS